MDAHFCHELERDFARFLTANRVWLDGPPRSAMNTPETRVPPSRSQSTVSVDSTSRTNPTALVRERLPQMANVIDQFDKRGEKFARDDRNRRQARNRESKDQCATCRQKTPPGTSLYTCSLCRSIHYCSKQCQRDHWKGGHRQECTTFARPPLAKTFDTSDRLDIPWPIDPVFATTHKEGMGVWVTPSEEFNAILQTAYVPPEGHNIGLQPYGPPSFMRWAGLDSERPLTREWGPEMDKYLGPTLANLRFVVQNRRKDGHTVVVSGAETALVAYDNLRGNMLPEDLSEVAFETVNEGRQLMHVFPWKDYNQRFRVSILEINGAVAPKGYFSPTDDEYVCADPPTGKPWERVIDWDTADVVLTPGDFVVFCAQYRVGDGRHCDTYPAVMTRCCGTTIACYLSDAKITDPDWRASVGRQMHLTRILSQGQTQPPCHAFGLLADFDHDYMEEYYRPYFEEGPDVFSAKRFGKSARALLDHLKKTYPTKLKKMLEDLPPPARQMFVDMWKKSIHNILPILEQI